jgi:hypothetical protein
MHYMHPFPALLVNLLAGKPPHLVIPLVPLLQELLQPFFIVLILLLEVAGHVPVVPEVLPGADPRVPRELPRIVDQV